VGISVLLSAAILMDLVIKTPELRRNEAA
jgi:hypothetical protein